jgi:hypothetical protein
VSERNLTVKKCRRELVDFFDSQVAVFEQLTVTVFKVYVCSCRRRKQFCLNEHPVSAVAVQSNNKIGVLGLN